MSEVEVEPEELRDFGHMLGQGGEEAKTVGDKMHSFFTDAGKEADDSGAYGLFCLNYTRIGTEVFGFYSHAEGALNRSKEVHQDLATEYETVDRDNADKVGADFRDDEQVAENAHPDEEYGASAGSNNKTGKGFKYMPSSTDLGDPDGATKKQDTGLDPQLRLDIPEIKDYAEAANWAATWGMDITILILPFLGDWPRAHAYTRSLRDMARVNNDIAGNIRTGTERIAESWTGESASASQEYMSWAADHIAGCENTLQDLSQSLAGYIEQVDTIAESMAECMGWFLWEADWAMWAQTPSGPAIAKIPDFSFHDAVGGAQKIEMAKHLKQFPLDWQLKKIAGWTKYVTNQYTASAYIGIITGLLRQFEIMVISAMDFWNAAAHLESPVNATNSDLEQAAERLDALGNWGEKK